MGLITTSAFAKAVWPGVKLYFGLSYKDHEVQWDKIFTKETSTLAYEEYVSMSGTGLAPVIAEGEAVSYDTMAQGFVSRLTNVKYGLGIKVTEEAVDDGQGIKIATEGAKSLARSLRKTKEQVGANVLNRAFSTSYLGADGLELCSLLHINRGGGTYKNELTTASDLNEYALEQACIDIDAWTDDRGLPIGIKPVRLIIHGNDRFNAERLLKTPGRVDSADNDINAIRSIGIIPGGYHVNNQLTDSDAWFLITDCANGMIYQERRKDGLAKDKEFDTDNFCFKGVGRYTFGYADPKGIFASPGG